MKPSAKMKKLLHNELNSAAVDFAARRIAAEVFYEKLITLFRDHFSNLGLSEDAFRYWSYDPSPELERKIRHEFKSLEVYDGLRKADAWLKRAANTSKAFRASHHDRRSLPDGSKLPVFSSIMWRYYYRYIDPPKANPLDAGQGPTFYDAANYAPAEARRPTRVNREPGDASAQNDKAADFGHDFV